MGSGMHRKWEILSSYERHEASECVELVLKKRTMRWRFIVRDLSESSPFFVFHPRSANLRTIPLNSKYICAVSLWKVFIVYVV